MIKLRHARSRRFGRMPRQVGNAMTKLVEALQVVVVGTVLALMIAAGIIGIGHAILG